MKKAKEKSLIGRIETVDFPELNMFGVAAKVDTGAYTTALHCQDIYEMKEGKEKILCFKTLDPSFKAFNDQEVRVTKYIRRKIKSSFGHFETRFIIKTPIALGNKTIETEVSLTDRAQMKYPVLLGRKFLSEGFIINVNKVNLASAKRKKKIKKTV